jgi:hypothetical protein
MSSFLVCGVIVMIAKRDDAIDSLADLVLDGGAVDSDGPPQDTEETALQALAFTVWAFEAGRDVSAVQVIVADRTGITLPLSLLREWRRVGQWAENFRGIHQTLGTESKSTVIAMSTLANVRAMRALLDVMEHGRDGDRVRAAMTVLDRFGYPAMIRGELFNGLEIGVSDVDDEQLESQWLDYSPDPIAARHGDTSPIERIQETQHRATTRLAHQSA